MIGLRATAAAVTLSLLLSGCPGPRNAPAVEGSSNPASPVPPPTFTWPVPEGWRAETIPFPLDFAPTIPYRGVEELRFPPGMFKPEAPLYFSYAFVFWLEQGSDLSEQALEEALRLYFQGLTAAVGESRKLQLDTRTIRAELEPASLPRPVLGHQVVEQTGTISTYDPFSTGAPLQLRVEVWTWTCPVAQRPVALFIASPRPPMDPAWSALEERRSSFACHH